MSTLSGASLAALSSAAAASAGFSAASWTTPSHIHALASRSEEHTSELQSRFDIVCRLLLEKKNSDQSTCRSVDPARRWRLGTHFPDAGVPGDVRQNFRICECLVPAELKREDGCALADSWCGVRRTRYLFGARRGGLRSASRAWAFAKSGT